MAEQVAKNTLAGKYLSFILKNEIYGINVDYILQIIAIPQITPIPNAPEFIKGVINLRGKIIPVIDLRLRFNLEEAPYNARTSIIVIKATIAEEELFIGVIVDTVQEVIDITLDQIEDKPAFGVKSDTDYIIAMAKVKQKVITLLDIVSVLSKEDLKKIKS